MEKIKQIFSSNKDDENNLSQGTTGTTNTGHGLTGEGSHLGATHNTTGSGTTSTIPGSFPESGLGNTSNTRQGEGSHFGSTRDNVSGLGNTQHSALGSSTVSGTGIGNSQTGGLGSTATSGLPNVTSSTGVFDPSRNTNTTTTTTSTTSGSGLGSTQQSGLGSTTTTTSGPHSSNLANKFDPTVDSDNSRSRKTTSTGIEGGQNSSLPSSNATHSLQSSNITNNLESEDGVPRGPGGGITNGLENAIPGHHTSGLASSTGTSGLGNNSNITNTNTNAGHSLHSSSGNSGLGNTTNTTNTGSGSHLGRDAAVLGTAGAVGEGIHHHRDNGHGVLGQGTSTSQSGLLSHHSGNTANTGGITSTGPHTTATANLLDPRVNTQGSSHKLEDAHHHSLKHGGGAEEADHHHASERSAGTTGVGSTGLGHSTIGQHDHTGASGLQSGAGGSTGLSGQTGSRNDQHLGRDAALTGGVGAAALGAGHHHKAHTTPGLAGASSVGQTSSTTPQSSSLIDRSVPGNSSVNTGDRSSNLTDRTGHESSRDHHLGRDAALAGGVGGAALGAERHHHNDTTSGVGSTGTTSHTSNLTDRSVAGNTANTGQHSSNLTDRTAHDTKEHHHGRDAAVAGGVGGAAYEAEKHHKHDKDLTEAEREQKREHKHQVKEEKKEHAQHKQHDHDHHDDKEKKHGLLSFLHRDKSKKYTKEEEDEFDRQEREHNSHKGRNAALGGAAVGTGAYEADKHHNHGTTHDSQLNKSLPTAPGNHGVGTGAGTQNALEAGHEGHQHSKTGGPLPLDEKPKGKDLGDILHGVDRNRGVTGASGFPDSAGFGTGQTHSGGGLLHQGQNTGAGQQHLGRDAAIGAGAATLGEEHHSKHERHTGNNTSSGIIGNHGQQSSLTGTQHNTSSGLTSGLAGTHSGQASGLTGNQYDNTSSALTGNQTSGLTGSHGGQASGLTGNQFGNNSSTLSGNQSSGLTGTHGGQTSGLTSGLTGKQYDNTSSTIGSNQTSGLNGAHNDQTSGGLAGNNNTSDLTGSHDRNRLHKDPPAGHPAAQGGVPASSAERSNLINEGEKALDGKTGVANSHSTNPSTNY